MFNIFTELYSNAATHNPNLGTCISQGRVLYPLGSLPITFNPQIPTQSQSTGPPLCLCTPLSCTFKPESCVRGWYGRRCPTHFMPNGVTEYLAVCGGGFFHGIMFEVYPCCSVCGRLLFFLFMCHSMGIPYFVYAFGTVVDMGCFPLLAVPNHSCYKQA